MAPTITGASNTKFTGHPLTKNMKNMKTNLLLATVLLSASLSAPAALLFDSGFSNGGVIPDNTTIWEDTRAVSGLLNRIETVSVTLNISGGYNGDLYGYLSFGGATLVLLNRVGVGTGSEPTFTFGFSGAGFFNLHLADNALIDVHDNGGLTTGAFWADGRNVSPTTSPSALDDAHRLTFTEQFGGMNPNGNWTLAFADMSGGNTSTLLSWELNITEGTTPVPEPIHYALGIFGLVFVGVRVGRFYTARRAHSRSW